MLDVIEPSSIVAVDPRVDTINTHNDKREVEIQNQPTMIIRIEPTKPPPQKLSASEFKKEKVAEGRRQKEIRVIIMKILIILMNSNMIAEIQCSTRAGNGKDNKCYERVAFRSEEV